MSYTNSESIVSLDTNGNLVSEYSSAKQAAKQLNIPYQKIINILVGRDLICKENELFFVKKDFYKSTVNYSLSFRTAVKNVKQKLNKQTAIK